MKLTALTLSIFFLVPALGHAQDNSKKLEGDVPTVVIKIDKADLARIKSQAMNEKADKAKDKKAALLKIDEKEAKLTKSTLDLRSDELLCKTGCGEWKTETPPADVLKTLAFDFPKPETPAITPPKSPDKKKDKKPATKVATVDCTGGAHCQSIR